MDRERLQQIEADLTRAALAALDDQPLRGRYDLGHLQAFHPAAEKHLRGLRRSSFVERVFREGNGRTQRAFFRQLSRDAGWSIDWSNLEADENVEASIASLRGDNVPLWTMLNRLVAEEQAD